jgi:hypothetical protein
MHLSYIFKLKLLFYYKNFNLTIFILFIFSGLIKIK